MWIALSKVAVGSRSVRACALGWACALLFAGVPAAQAQSEPALEIVDELPGCVSAASLRARVKELLADQAWPSELRVELQLRAAPPRFSVSKRGSVFAERRFERLMSSCAERRDTVAVAIVLAVENYLADQEGVAGEPAPPAAERAQEVARDQRGGLRAQGGERAGSDANASERARADASASERARADVSAGEDSRADAGASELAPAASLQEVATAQQAGSNSDAAMVDAEPTSAEHASLPPPAAHAVSLFAGGQWLWAAAPSAAAALSAGMELSLGELWSVGVAGVWAPPAEHALAAGPKRLSAQLFAGQLFGCGNARGHVVVLQGCAGAVGGALDAEGRGFDHPRRVALAWGALLLRAAVQWPAQGALALRARADARVNVLRPEPEVPGPGAFSAPVGLFGADLGIDLLWRVR